MTKGDGFKKELIKLHIAIINFFFDVPFILLAETSFVWVVSFISNDGTKVVK